MCPGIGEIKEHLKTQRVLIIDEDDRLEIRPADDDLARFVDAVEVESDHFDDYHSLRKGLRKDAVY